MVDLIGNVFVGAVIVLFAFCGFAYAVLSYEEWVRKRSRQSGIPHE